MMNPKTKTVIFLVVAFLLGGVCGAMLIRQFSRPMHGSRSTPKDIIKEFSERLQLDSRQTTQVDSILELRRLRMEGYRTYMVSVRDSARGEIRKILNENQNKIFDTYIKEMSEREERYRSQEPERRQR
jgi:hypothetical protein